MKKLFCILCSVLILGFALNATAADVLLKWEGGQYATGYRIYQSVDDGVTWDAGIDVGDVIQYTYTGVPDSGLVIFRIGAYNTYGETINSWSGAWYNGDWNPPYEALGLRGDLIP